MTINPVTGGVELRVEEELALAQDGLEPPQREGEIDLGGKLEQVGQGGVYLSLVIGMINHLYHFILREIINAIFQNIILLKVTINFTHSLC